MIVEYIVCDRCAASVPEATGAIVLPYNGRPRMHLCGKCFEEVFVKPDATTMKLKGDLVNTKQEAQSEK